MNLGQALVFGALTALIDVAFVRFACWNDCGDSSIIAVSLLSIASLLTFRVAVVTALYFDENGVRADWAIAYTLRAVEAESTAILSNLLPAHAVASITQGTQVVPRLCPRAVVLVLDLVNFTALAATMTSRELMDLLNLIYSKLDEVVEESGLWKVENEAGVCVCGDIGGEFTISLHLQIDTVGDSYIAVSTGIDQPAGWTDYAKVVGFNAGDGSGIEDCYRTRYQLESTFALAARMLAVLKRLREVTGLPIHSRIGVDAGKLVAGLIGSKRPRYCKN
jgi:adenylate cyclase